MYDRFRKTRRGAGAVEYGLVIALVAAGALIAVQQTGGSIAGLLSGAAGKLNSINSAVQTVDDPSLYEFTAHTFTSCGQTGRLGPTLSQCRSAYSAADWAQNDDGLSMTTQGIQRWTVPETATYSFEIAAPSLHANTSTGPGSVITATVDLTAGETVNIVVGQRGVGPWPVQSGDQPRSNDGLGGPGGSFVYTGGIGGSGLIGAAGGGNVNCTPSNLASCPGRANDGRHGDYRHTSSVVSGPGTGWLSSAGKDSYRVQGGQRFVGGNESDCGYASCAQQPGGFGGGGGSGNDNIGGSGGYTGGANAGNNDYSSEGYPGGSSPVSATRSQSVVFTRAHTGAGYVTVTKQ